MKQIKREGIFSSKPWRVTELKSLIKFGERVNLLAHLRALELEREDEQRNSIR